jgi:hypothetical protein
MIEFSQKIMIVAIDDQLLKENINTDLTNDGKKKSIIHIQDLGSSAASQKLSTSSRYYRLFLENIIISL